MMFIPLEKIRMKALHLDPGLWLYKKAVFFPDAQVNPKQCLVEKMYFRLLPVGLESAQVITYGSLVGKTTKSCKIRAQPVKNFRESPLLKYRPVDAETCSEFMLYRCLPETNAPFQEKIQAVKPCSDVPLRYGSLSVQHRAKNETEKGEPEFHTAKIANGPDPVKK